MIAACPKCGSRYRIERERIEPAGARLRCSRCQVVFRVRPPGDAPPAVVEAVAAPPATASEVPAAQPSPQPAPQPPGPRVLLATPNDNLAKETCAALERWGFDPVHVADGVQAMLEVQRQLPQAIIVAADLPGMFGFQICEVVKRNESLRGIHVVLIGAIHSPDRYRRSPEELYGADAYLEEPDLPDGLASVLGGFGLPLRQPPRTEPRRPAPAPPPPVAAEPVPAPAPAPAPTTPVAAPAAAPRFQPAPGAEPPVPPLPQAPAPALDGLEEQREEAERLARIIVSDIVLYNAEKFSAALAGDVVEAMGSELSEGRALFKGRVDERVRGEKDHILEELQRVARTRAGR